MVAIVDSKELITDQVPAEGKYINCNTSTAFAFACLSVAGAFIMGPANAIAASASATNLHVSVKESYSMGTHYDMLLQNYSNKTIFISRIVINRKINTVCDYKGDELWLVRFPFRLDYGDSKIIGGTGCGRPIHVDVYTNHGTLPFDFEY